MQIWNFCEFFKTKWRNVIMWYLKIGDHIAKKEKLIEEM